MNNIQIECVLNIKAALGESPVWSTMDQKLYWVDITEGLFCSFDPNNGINKSIDLGRPIGCFALKKNGNAIVALTDGFFELNKKTEELKLINDTESNITENRFNDGTVDLKGRFYAGTMPIKGSNKDDTPKGTLYCLDELGNVKKIMEGFYTINGLAFSPDAKTAYVSDSAFWVRTIWAYDYDLDNGICSNKRFFLAGSNSNLIDLFPYKISCFSKLISISSFLLLYSDNSLIKFSSSFTGKIPLLKQLL